MTKILVICGPTGSGKTEFAHKIALERNGEIINCDSMQIYSEIPILTASPRNNLKAEVPYHLYNFQSVTAEFSVAKYAGLAAKSVHEIIARRNFPIIVGGTGMYINSLLYGYNSIPKISSEIRENAKYLHENIGQEEFFKLLADLDPTSSVKIKPGDTQRSLRAYEVYTQTGKSIFTFQNEDNILPLAGLDFEIIFLNPARGLLYQMCNKRLTDIFNNGGKEEAKNIMNNFPALATPAAKAIGLQELILYLNNKYSFEEAAACAQQRTRNYAKRQVTWFKHQLKDKRVLEYSTSEEFEQIKKNFSF